MRARRTLGDVSLALCAFGAWTVMPSSQPCPPAAPPNVPSFQQRLTISPEQARVFAGDSVTFHASTAGFERPTTSWHLVGAGRLGGDGVYHAPDSAGGDRAFVVARSSDGGAVAAPVEVVAPPRSVTGLAVASCYDGGTLDVLQTAAGPGGDAFSLRELGAASAGNTAAGIVADRATGRAYVAAGDRVARFDVRSARLSYSDAVAGARFSEIARIGTRYVVATDNDASAGTTGVRVFDVGGAKPALVASAPAGETPEGVAVSHDGATIYVTNVNSNSVMRFTFDRRGALHLTGAAATGHRPFGVAVDDGRALLFVADNDTPTVSGAASRPGLEVFSLPSLRRVRRIDTGRANALPLGVAADTAADRVFVTNEGDGDVVAYQASTLRRVAALRVGRTPWLPSIDAAGGRLFVPAAQDDALWVADERTLRPLVRAMPTCGYPTSVAAF